MIFLKNFLLLAGVSRQTKPEIVFQLENPVQFGRRAAKRRDGKFDFSLLAPAAGFEPAT
jgi:hypothetical protein